MAAERGSGQDGPVRARSLLTLPLLLPRATDATGVAWPRPSPRGKAGPDAHAQSDGRAEAHVAHGAAGKGGATFRGMTSPSVTHTQ